VYLAVGVGAAMPITRRQVRRTTWASGEHVVAFRSGWLWRSVTLAPASKIQTVTATESPFDRRTAMAAVRIDTAGGSATSHRLRVPFLARETALALTASLSAKAARTEFRW
jgi:putative membrane protein